MSDAARQSSAAARQAALSGNEEGAWQLLKQALARYPGDAELLGQAASLALRRKAYDEAIALYRRAITVVPDNLALHLDLAIALTTGGYAQAALQTLKPLEDAHRRDPRYWSIRANAAREAGQMAEAAKNYDTCLDLQRDHPRALQGRARVALERAEDEAVALFDRALRAMPSQADLWLGKAQALDAQGRTAEALALAAQLVDQAPQWVDALNFFAQLRSAAGERDFDAHFRTAAGDMPQQPEIPAAHIRQLASREKYMEAAEIAAEASARFPSHEFFALARAGNAGMAGELDEADRLFAKLAVTGPERSLQEGRHRLRRGDMEQAEAMLLEAAHNEETAHSAYALLEFVWRLTSDERAEWLHGQPGLIQAVTLPSSEAVLEEAVAVLSEIHDHSNFPVGQSLRGGTQTRHILFHRKEPILQSLRVAVAEALEIYRSGLPQSDPRHPLLHLRDTPWTFAGSWSVRLKSGDDHHASHIHPQGVLSSALYFILPETQGQQGCLEIGRPPPDLMLDLGPRQVIQPQLGHLALFPSTLFHGTTPFVGDTRMTVAFDVVPMIEAPDG